MAKQSTLFAAVVGGSYEADIRIAGCSVSQNLYAESVEGSEGQYYTTALRSIDGETVVAENLPGVCKGLFTASDGNLYGYFGDTLVKFPKGGDYMEYEELCTFDTANSERVRFAETGGINSHIVFVNGVDDCVYSYPLYPEKDASLGVSYPAQYPTPVRVYLTEGQLRYGGEDERVRPAHICCINGSLIIDDPETDTWYYTEAYMLGGTNSTRNIYSLDSDGNIQYVSGSTYEIQTTDVSLTATDSSSGTAYLWLDRYSKPYYQTAEYTADRIVSLVTAGDHVFALGGNSVQVYSQTTYTDAYENTCMSFSSSGASERGIGCEVAATVAVVGNSCVFLGSGSDGARGVWYTSGDAPTRISTSVMEREWIGVSTTSAFALAWRENGHSFYALTIPSVNKTYCFDFTTKQWHVRSTRMSSGRDGAWWPSFVAVFKGSVHFAGSEYDGLVLQDPDSFEDHEGRAIVKRRTCPAVTSNHAPFMLNEVQLVWGTGVTTDRNDTKASQNPVMILEVSRDGGNTFGNEMFGYGGKTGQYDWRTIWRGLGIGTMLVLRFTCSDRVKVVITGAKISHTQLSRF